MQGNDLRCAAPRLDKRTGEEVPCHRLIARTNKYGHIAGNFCCERCKEEIEVRMAPLPRPGSNRSPRGRKTPQSPIESPMRFGETQINDRIEVSP